MGKEKVGGEKLWSSKIIFITSMICFHCLLRGKYRSFVLSKQLGLEEMKEQHEVWEKGGNQNFV